MGATGPEAHRTGEAASRACLPFCRGDTDAPRASDYIHPTPRGGQCRVCIYLPEEEQDAPRPVVICSELPNNGSTAVTYAAEQLAVEVIRSHELPTPLLVCIEH